MLEGFVPYPDAFVKRYKEKGYWVEKTLGEEFDECVNRYRDRVALAQRTGALEMHVDVILLRALALDDDVVAAGVVIGARHHGAALGSGERSAAGGRDVLPLVRVPRAGSAEAACGGARFVQSRPP